MLVYQPFQIKNVTLKNRWVMAPMCMYAAVDGVANDFHLVHYGSRALGGVGLIIVEATGVTREGLITPGCLGLWTDEQTLALKKIVDFVHKHSETKMAIQLAHSGRKGSIMDGKELPLDEGGWQTVAPSAIPYHTTNRLPRVLSIAEIQEIVEAFKQAAQRAVQAGFDIIEIHTAHGYLLNEFLSPLTNTRTDSYGGSFENRTRFLMEVIDAVNAVIGDTPLFVRISATEHEPDGWNLEDSIRLSAMLKDRQVDLIDVSSGGNLPTSPHTPYDTDHAPMSDAIKKAVGIQTGVVGMIEDAERAESILQRNEADLIFVGRALLRNPALPVLESFKTDAPCFIPEAYKRGKPSKK